MKGGQTKADTFAFALNGWPYLLYEYQNHDVLRLMVDVPKIDSLLNEVVSAILEPRV